MGRWQASNIQLALGKQLELSSLGRTISPAFRIPCGPVACRLRLATMRFPLPCWHVFWCHSCPHPVWAVMLLRRREYRSPDISRKHNVTEQTFYSSVSCDFSAPFSTIFSEPGYRKCTGNIKVFVIYVTAVGKQGPGARTVREKVSICERDGRGEGMTEMTKLSFNFKK